MAEVSGAEVARNALREMQRPDLADCVEGVDFPLCSLLVPWHTHRMADGTMLCLEKPDLLTLEDRKLIGKAFVLGHQAMGHDCHSDGHTGIHCLTCLSHYVVCSDACGYGLA